MSAKTGEVDEGYARTSRATPPYPRAESRDAGFDKSLFERFDIDPRQGPRAITERLRELVEEAPEHERNEIRAAWEELTLHPMRRLRAAFAAHPESRPPLGSPPPLPRDPVAISGALSLAELAPRPSVARALNGGRPAATRPPGVSPLSIGVGDLPSLEDDPILKKRP